jgi:hypothetical protein
VTLGELHQWSREQVLEHGEDLEVYVATEIRPAWYIIPVTDIQTWIRFDGQNSVVIVASPPTDLL